MKVFFSVSRNLIFRKKCVLNHTTGAHVDFPDVADFGSRSESLGHVKSKRVLTSIDFDGKLDCISKQLEGQNSIYCIQGFY